MIDFAEKFYGFDKAAQNSNKRIKTNLMRIVPNDEAKRALGIERRGGVTYTVYPPKETAKGLGYVISLLKKGEIDVNDLRHSEDVERQVKAWPTSALPDPSKKLNKPVPLDDYTFDRVSPDSGEETSSADSRPAGSGGKKTPKKRKRKSKPQVRSALIPSDWSPEINKPRLNNIYVELSHLNHNAYTEAASVLLRVFLELSTDYYIEIHNVIPDMDGQRKTAILAKKLKAVANHLRSTGNITQDLQESIKKIADADRYIHASVPTMHQYVHHLHAAPVASELETIWDHTLQPFLDKVFS